jgi:hypothetical protein
MVQVMVKGPIHKVTSATILILIYLILAYNVLAPLIRHNSNSSSYIFSYIVGLVLISFGLCNSFIIRKKNRKAHSLLVSSYVMFISTYFVVFKLYNINIHMTLLLSSISVGVIMSFVYAYILYKFFYNKSV